jgi:hypothetical protein
MFHLRRSVILHRQTVARSITVSAEILFPIHIIHLRQPSNIWMKRSPRPFRQMDSHRFITRIDHTTKNIMTLCKDLILLWKLYLQLIPWSRVLPEKLADLQLVKKFPAFYGIRRFITAFKSAHHLSRS